MQQAKARMTEQERWIALLNRQPVDRASFLTMGNAVFCCTNVGYTVSDAYASARRSFEAARKTADQYGHFPFTYAIIGGSYGAWEFGGELRLPTSEYEMAPSVVRHPVQSEGDVWKLTLPDVKKAGSIPNTMEFCMLQAAVPDMPIVPTVHTVLTIAGNLVGVETLARWMMRRPELVHHLVRLAADHFVEVADHWLDIFGPERLVLFSAAPTESNQIFSPKHFEEFVLPYQKEVHETVLALGIRHLYIHICGEQNLNLPLWAQIPMGDPGIVSFGHEVDLEMAARYFPHDIIVGNLHPPTLHLGTGEEVYELCRICIEKGKKAPGGFMLAAGCTVSPLTPPYNYWVMQKALDDLGWYD